MGSQYETANVLLTGFGPFGGHDVNASWEAVKELVKSGIPQSIKIHAREIPVDYQYVMNQFPKICEQLKPDLIINVGLSGITEVVQIEQCAHKTGYDREDTKGYAPKEKLEKQECLTTSIDINELITYCNEHQCCCEIAMSDNAGRYLCEFIYYTSLSCHAAPAIFIHVPCLNMPYSKEQLAEALRFIIIGALQQISASK